ncbi:C-type natriuretic peptide [Sarcophilus harrisii]|uniref:C-type natriuretic peptide n=1 Tax=Sarcophilus harrisii TaxID=9305 RepID=A0A7N4V1F3_SARHA|nr:C-type natriuretic peptide [Sarcophilus harrisii]XP_031824007.1 C-type natriuretic peptide [Sarcophilus harrisii]
MHVSQLLIGTLLLTLLSLGSEAKAAPPQKSQRSPAAAEEPAEPQGAAAADKKAVRAAAGGGGANAKGSNARLLRDLRVETRSKAAWARLLHDYPNGRKYRGVTRRLFNNNCFGHKIDRIGAMSGLGC